MIVALARMALRIFFDHANCAGILRCEAAVRCVSYHVLHLIPQTGCLALSNLFPADSAQPSPRRHYREAISCYGTWPLCQRG
jgi:hypothetical protein